MRKTVLCAIAAIACIASCTCDKDVKSASALAKRIMGPQSKSIVFEKIDSEKDVYELESIYKTQGKLDNLNIYMVGDLKYGRTVHSLLMSMRKYSPTFHFIAPKELEMPEEYKLYCQQKGIKYVEQQDFTEDTIADADILYMTRVQRERFTDLMEYERVKDAYILKADMLGKCKENMKILHPLPRVNEIEYAVDDSKHAYYFEQAQNGLYARQALICDVLGITLDDVKNDTTII